MTDHELKSAKLAIAQIAVMGGAHTQLVLEYIKLFSSETQRLSLARTHSLLTEIADLWVNYTAQAWTASVQSLLQQQQEGSLNDKLPLQNHELLISMMDLFENFEPDDDDDDPIAPPPRPTMPTTHYVMPSPEPPERGHSPISPEKKADNIRRLAKIQSLIRKKHPDISTT